MVIIHQLEVWDRGRYKKIQKRRKKNKPRWYPQQPERFIFTSLSEACWEAKRWKHLSWAELNEPDLAWLLQPSPEPVETWLYTKASWNLLRNPLRNLLRNPVEPDLALHQSLPDLLRNLLRNLVEPNPAPAPMHTGAILGRRPH